MHRHFQFIFRAQSNPHWLETLVPLEAGYRGFEERALIIELSFTVNKCIVRIEVITIQHLEEGDLLPTAGPVDPGIDVKHLIAKADDEGEVDHRSPWEGSVSLVLV